MVKYFLIGLGIITIIFGTISYTKIFKIKNFNFQTTDNNCLNINQLKSQINLGSQTIFNINSQQIKAQITTKNLCVKDVDVQLKFPSQLNIKAIGRVPAVQVVILQTDKNLEASPSSQSATLVGIINQFQGATVSGSLIVDPSGLAFSNKINPNLLQIKLMTNRFDLGASLPANSVSYITQVNNQLKLFGVLPNQFLMYKDWLITSSNTSPNIIAFNLKSDLNYELASLQLILEQNKIDSKAIESLDLRFDKPVLMYAKR